MSRPGIEPRSPGPLANTLPTGAMSRTTVITLPYYFIIVFNYLDHGPVLNRLIDSNVMLTRLGLFYA